MLWPSSSSPSLPQEVSEWEGDRPAAVRASRRASQWGKEVGHVCADESEPCIGEATKVSKLISGGCWPNLGGALLGIATLDSGTWVQRGHLGVTGAVRREGEF